MKKIRSLIKKIKVLNPHVQIGIYGVNSTNEKNICVRSGAIFGTASLIKVPIAVTLFRLHEDNIVDIDRRFHLGQFTVLDKGQRDSGVLKFLPKDTSVSLRFLCSLMLSLSDNAATNIVLKFVTRNQINAHMRKLGLMKTRITMKTINPKKLEKDKNLLGVTTPEEMTRLFQMLAGGKIGGGNEIVGMMRMAQSHQGVFRGLSTAKNVKDQFITINNIFSKGGIFPEFLLNVQTMCVEMNDGAKIFISIFTQGIGHERLRSVALDHPSNSFIAQAVHIIIKELL